MPKRASNERTLEFANELREAGGASVIPGLLPSIPTNPHQCVLAQAVNFGSNVDRAEEDLWYAELDLPIEKIKEIAEKLSLDVREEQIPSDDEEGGEVTVATGVYLPEDIGQVAADFDKLHELLEELECQTIIKDFQKEELNDLADLYPLIDQATKETYEINKELFESLGL